jgi:hypothetical protein
VSGASIDSERGLISDDVHLGVGTRKLRLLILRGAVNYSQVVKREGFAESEPSGPELKITAHKQEAPAICTYTKVQ